MPPVLTPLLTSRGYGRLSVSHGYTHLLTVPLLMGPFFLENHRSFIHFGEDRCCLPLEQSNLYWERQVVDGVLY